MTPGPLCGIWAIDVSQAIGAALRAMQLADPGTEAVKLAALRERKAIGAREAS